MLSSIDELIDVRDRVSPQANGETHTIWGSNGVRGTDFSPETAEIERMKKGWRTFVDEILGAGHDGNTGKRCLAGPELGEIHAFFFWPPGIPGRTFLYPPASLENSGGDMAALHDFQKISGGEVTFVKSGKVIPTGHIQPGRVVNDKIACEIVFYKETIGAAKITGQKRIFFF